MNDRISYSHTHLSEVDSTNRYIRQNSQSLWTVAGNADALVVTTDFQSDGRGQQGNTWDSNTCENVLMSILLQPSFLGVRKQFALSQVVALALYDAMCAYGVNVELKWPNDIYVGNRKLAGILVELDYATATVEQAVIGVGLNVNQTKFGAMDKIPVSMKMLSGKDFLVGNVVETIKACFSHRYAMLQNLEFEKLSEEYLLHLKGYKDPLRYRDAHGLFIAQIVGVTSLGALVLQRSDGTISQYFFKEVEMILS